MRWFFNLGMRVKLLGLVAAMLLVVGGIFIWMFNQQVRQAARTESVERAACVVDMAESVRQGMAEKWSKGVFSQQQMKEWQQQGAADKILAAVPIVSAWEAVMRRAEDGGYQFKTPRFNPRNPSNAPDEIEAEALKLFAKDPTLEAHSLIDTEQNAVRYFRPIRLSSECMMCHGDPASSMALWGNQDGLDATGYQMENLKVGDLHGAFEVIQSLDESDATAKAAVLSGTLVIVCFLVVCCGVLAFVLDRTLLKPLTAASNAFEKLVAGDLRSTLQVSSGDEVGRMQAGINTLVDRLKSLILQMRGSSDELTEVSDGLNGTATRVEGAVSETTSRSLTVSSAAEEMSVAMQDMGGSLKEVSGSIQTVAAATSQVSSNAESVARSTQEASDVASKALELSADGSRRISEMEAAAEGIDNIVLVIQNLAEQTNLLALNATIESARAGEAGKGFAVVADEVKMLSQQTSAATSEIRKEVDQIQDLSRLVVSSIAAIKDAATEVNGKTEEIATAVNEQRGAIESVSDQISNIAKNTESITENVEQTVIASREVAEQIVGVSGIAEDTSKEVESTKSAGQNVERVSNQFTEMLSGFQVD